MAITTIKSTYALDVATVRALEGLARRWNVSKSEALRRAVRVASGQRPAQPGDVELAIRIVGEPLPFLGDDGPLSARLFNLGGRRRGSLGDCMIAAAAIRTGATLATVNTIDFRRFESAGLRLAAG